LFRPTLAAIDHAIAKGVLTENTGNRYKSRLSLAFNALNASKATAKKA
jgi:ribosomal protein S20